MGLAALTILGLDRLMTGGAAGQSGIGLDFRLLPWQWVLLALLPLAVALIAMITAIGGFCVPWASALRCGH